MPNQGRPSETASSAHDRVYRSLRQQIMHGELAPGQALTLRGLARRFEVSMTPAREALRWSVVLLAVCSFALFPKLSTRLAVFLGYNNGRFLALYASVIVLFVCVVLLYSRTRKLSREITLLVRQIAIQRGHDAIEDRRRDQKLDARSGDQDSCSV